MSDTLVLEAADGKPALRCLRADNASPMTHTGTMTYLLGRGQVVLIDPGPADPAHLDAILRQLDPGERIVALLATHAHADHVGGMAALRSATGAPSLGFGPAGTGRSPVMRALLEAGLPDAGEGFDWAYLPDQSLGDGQVIDPAGFAIRVLHTPGHTGCSLCFAVGDWLFTGDLAMGSASSLIAPPDGDLGAYIDSLIRLSARPWSRLLPGHGLPVTNPAERLAELIRHRRLREAQIRQALALGLSDIPGLTGAIYHDTPAALLPAARRNVLAHLIDLCARGLVRADPAALPDASFRPA